MDDHLKNLLKELEKVLMERVEDHGFSEEGSLFYTVTDEIKTKIDLLDRTLGLLRIKYKHLDNAIALEDFIQGSFKLDSGKIRYYQAKELKSLGSGTKPIFLQPKLLRFLFYRHNKKESVFNIIEGFINVIWDFLSPVDFKRTATGVTRCYTNTRFAANTLRDYGLLKFTKGEAYKTWKLSLPGFLVASKVAESGDWQIYIQNNNHGYALHHEIREAFVDLSSFDAFIKRLARFCEPTSKICEDFKVGLGRAYTNLAKYGEVIRNKNLSNKERLERSKGFIKLIDDDEEIQQFYKEFLKCYRIGNLESMK